jgi:hypothetical protein
MQIPIKASTFKKGFIDGDGSLEIPNDIWRTLIDAGRPFTKEAGDLVNLQFSAGTSKDLQLGDKGGVRLGVSFKGGLAGSIDLIWPGEASDIIKTYQLQEFLTPDKLYVALVFKGTGEGSAKGSYPIGPLSASFGIGAGGSVEYDRVALYDQGESAKDILADLFAGVRLPQSVGSVDQLPAPGEVLVLRHGGYLNLNAGLAWGYNLTGSRSFEVRDLALSLDYALRVMASVSLDYRLAGNFSLEVRRGAEPKWGRLIVRKDRLSEFNLAADFGFTATADLEGLPDSADEFLAALLGTDAETILGYLAKAEKYSSLDELEQAVGQLASGFVHNLADKWIGKTLSNSTLQEFLGVAERVVETYQNIDQRILDVFADFVDRQPKLTEILNLLGGVGRREDLQKLTDADAWDLIRRVWNDKLYDLLLKNEEFEAFAGFIAELRDFKNGKIAKEVRTLIVELKKAFPLDDLFQKLEKIDTPEKLKALADEKLQGLVEKVIGKAFDQLKASEFGEASKRLNSTLKKIQSFKDKWYEKITQAVHQSFAFDLHYAYTRAQADKALIDVEVNLGRQAGAQLFAKASAGDLAGLLKTYDPGLVRLNTGLLTHELRKSAQVQVNVMGWSFQGIVDLVQQSEHSIETEVGGLLHVYTLDTYIKQRREQGKKFKEVLQSNFLLRAVGETFQPAGSENTALDPKTNEYVIKTLTKMSVQYDLLYDDERTDAKELTQYLEMAEFLGLIPSRERMVEELAAQFPEGLGKTSVNYVVRYDERAVRSAFTLSGDELRDLARRTARRLIAAKYIGMRRTEWLARVGFAYLDPAFYELYRNGFPALLANGKAVRLPSWFTGGTSLVVGLEPAHRNLVLTLFNVEKNYAERLVEFDAIVDRSVSKREPISQDELAQAARRFVEMADDLDKFGRENTFFAIFDKLIQEGGSGKGRRESAMILEITPPSGEKVVKYLMA